MIPQISPCAQAPGSAFNKAIIFTLIPPLLKLTRYKFTRAICKNQKTAKDLRFCRLIFFVILAYSIAT